MVKLKLWPILREVAHPSEYFIEYLIQCGFYLVALLLFLFSVRDGLISIAESLLNIGVYGIYIASIATGFVMQRSGDSDCPTVYDVEEVNSLIITTSVPTTNAVQIGR